jgi:hypothetical protein
VSEAGALGLPQLGRTASNGPLPVAETSAAAAADGPRIAVRLANRIRTSAGMPPEDSDVVLLPRAEAEALIGTGQAVRAGVQRPSWLVMSEPSDWPTRKRQREA